MYLAINTISVLFYFCYLYILYKKHGSLTTIPLYFIFSQTWIILSSYYLDIGNIYTYELDLFTSSSLATSFLVLINIIFLFVYFNWLELRGVNSKSDTDDYAYRSFTLVDSFIFFYIFLLFYSFKVVGYVPLISGIDRATYTLSALETIPFNYVFGYFLPICFVIATLVAYKKINNRNTIINYVQLALIIIYLFLASNKFSRIIQIVFFGFIPFFVVCQPKIKIAKLLKFTFFGIASVLLIIFVQSEIFSYFSAIGGDSIFEYLLTRIFVLQGQIWWKTYNFISIDSILDFNHLKVEMQTLMGIRHGYEYVGLDYLMEICTQGKFIYNIIENGNYKYTGAFPAILLVTFNYLLIIPIVIVISVIYAEISYWLKSALQGGNLLMIFLSFLVYLNLTVLLLTGNFSQFFSLSSFAKILLLFFFNIVIIVNNKLIRTKINVSDQF